MSHQIQRVAVLGAGVMGAGIAAHLANAGVPSLLFDLNPELARKGLDHAKKSKPAALYRKDLAGLITPCTYDDDADKLASCDWIIEVVIERLDIKKKVFSWVAANRREGSILTSNTSGITLADMVAEMPAEMGANFFITHFFNPPRYMKLLEFVTAPNTSKAAIDTLADFGARVLGKGIVYGKDTPNFVANRIGTYGMASVFRHMGAAGLSIEEVDAIFGTASGRAKSAVFKTGDLVGIDTLKLVFGNVYHNAPDDEEREAFVVPKFIDTLIAAGNVGRKAGAGFYKKVGRKILVLDVETGEYRAKQPVRYASIGAARKSSSPQGKIRALCSGDDKAGVAAWTVTADTLIYAANRIPEIADDIVQIDNAMKWGFGWEIGPFEVWDAIGVADSVARMKAEGRTVPAWVEAMLSSGRESFYDRDQSGPRFWDKAGQATSVPTDPRHLFLRELKHANRELSRNESASLWDLGDNVLGLEFHSKMNTLDPFIVAQYTEALDKLDNNEFAALVVGNQDGRAFCAGANVFLVQMAAMQGQWDQIDQMLLDLQNVVSRAKYSTKPVVTAPYGLTFGGGLEVAMQASAAVAHGEMYAGQVEAGVGVIPAAGGCRELLTRYLGDIPAGVDYDPNPFVQQVFKLIGLATVSTSAEEARSYGFLRPTDKVVLDADAQLAEAKKLALGMAMSDWAPPKPKRVKLPGPQGAAAIELFLYSMREGGFATPHDMVVGGQLAKVLTGGDIPSNSWVDEQHILDLEREAFLYLAGTPKTMARIQHMLTTNKPLRN